MAVMGASIQSVHGAMDAMFSVRGNERTPEAVALWVFIEPFYAAIREKSTAGTRHDGRDATLDRAHVESQREDW